MLNKKPFKIIKPRELLAVEYTDQSKKFKLVYTEGEHSTEILHEVLISIEPEIVWAINLGDYIPITENAEVTILHEKGDRTGILKMCLIGNFLLEDRNIYSYRITSAQSNLLPFYAIIADNLAYALKKKLQYRIRDIMRLRKLFVYYLKPKPSFFLSVRGSGSFDIFPVDLTGKIADDFFSIAVKGTNKAIEVIKTTGSLCISALPFSKAALVYAHSEQRRSGNMSSKTLVFDVFESRTLKIPVPDFALHVNELHVEQIFEQGIYTVFILRSINQYTLSDALQLAHTPWYNKHFFSSIQPSALH